jgi:hypothetical protein
VNREEVIIESKDQTNDFSDELLEEYIRKLRIHVTQKKMRNMNIRN